MKWLRWLIVCRAGRRCANPSIVNFRGVWHEQPPPDDLYITISWVCEGCGREYERETRALDVYTP